MADKEIIKALECCSEAEIRADCERLGCPLFLGIYSGCKYDYNDDKLLYADALDLINRQQAEIERLKIENQALRMAANSYKLHYNEAKAEAVKEFAVRIKEKCHNYYPSIDSYCVSRKVVEIKDIDKLLKEMVGDTNENNNP